jgi:hypothetical protein
LCVILTHLVVVLRKKRGRLLVVVVLHVTPGLTGMEWMYKTWRNTHVLRACLFTSRLYNLD